MQTETPQFELIRLYGFDLDGGPQAEVLATLKIIGEEREISLRLTVPVPGAEDLTLAEVRAAAIATAKEAAAKVSINSQVAELAGD
jgi:hypothetical protein